MERTGVAASRMLAGLQILVGYFTVAPPAPELVATGPFAPTGRADVPSSAPVPFGRDVSFAVRPPGIRNKIWLVFRGTRDQTSGCLVGEIVPDLQMRLLGLVPTAMFGISGVAVAVAMLLVPLLGDGWPSPFGVMWACMALAFSVAWTRSCGAAIHEAARNVRQDSPAAQLTWHPGLRVGSRSKAPAPPSPSASSV